MGEKGNVYESGLYFINRVCTSIIEPFSCSKHATDRANITIEDVVVISGCGTLGMGMVGIAKLHNPKTLIVLDLKQSRLDKALEFGAVKTLILSKKYDDEKGMDGIESGTKPEDFPDDWKCPICKADKTHQIQQ